MLPQKPYHEGITRPDWTRSVNRDERVLWLDKNESVDPHYNRIVTEWVSEALPQVIYGYPDCSYLYHKLAKMLGVTANNIIFSAGSDGAIRLAYEAFVKPGDKILYPTPTFAMYAVYAQIYGAQALAIDYQRSTKGPQLDTAQFINLILKEKPTLVCLPNPDSPTGATVDLDIIHKIIRAAKEVGAVVLIDEAYYYFYNETVLPWIKEEENLLITRTFSKAWGLAGVRLGFALGSPKLISILHRLRPMYEVGTLSVSVAEKALDHVDEMLTSVKRILAGKRFFMDALKQLGFDVIENVQGNFMHVAFGQRAEAIHRALEEIVLYRKETPHPSLSGYSRFSATTKELYQPIVDRIELVLKAGS